jgi:8-oxo-dGTP pyrophosphatase MutT (NUDIX family)
LPRFDDASLARLGELFARRPAIEIDAPQIRRACVLIPILPSDDGWSLLFSRRSANLAAHSGQIAFPGGAVEEGESLEDAVKREADEEVGIPRDSVELIGRLDDVITNSGFLVAPFVGIINRRIEYVLQASEVDEVFEVPLDALLVPELPIVRYVTFRTRRYPVYSYSFGTNDIWGLTGRIVKAFLDVAWLAL